MPDAVAGPRARPGFATRLLLAQALVLVAGAATSWVVAAALGPGIFAEHLRRAGVSHTPTETEHVQEAFSSAMVIALLVALLVSLAVALAVTWFFTRRVQGSVGAVADSAARIVAGDFQARVPPPGLGREFDQLTGTFNAMAERLEAVERTRRRMLADLGHEMRTPLATITAHLEAIEDGVRRADAETLTLLRSSTERLERLAHDIDAVSKAEEGHLTIELEPMAPADLVEAALAAAGPAAEAKGVVLADDVAAELPAVLVDPDRIGQVLGNVLDNAVRHSPPGSTVRITCRSPDPGWVDVAVADQGDGIAREHLAHVFDRFYRADTARNRAAGGSGIGLTITRALVEAHGGAITAASDGPGRGATFSIRLPAVPGSPRSR